MRKIISMILAMAMILSMTAFAKVADTTAGDFDYRYSLYEIFNEDFNGFKTTDTKITCQGVDLDVKDTEGKVINPTKYAYVERAAGNMALELTVDEDIMATAAKGQRPYLGIHGGAITPPAGGGATYNVASFPGAQALIMEYEINFPEITTEPNKSVQFMFRLGQPGTKQYSFYASTAAEVTEDPSTKFSFRSGTNYVNVVEGKWHKVTEVVDLEEMVIHRYIDGALLGTTDISASGEIAQGGYYRVIGYEFLEQGIMIDNCHYYWAYDVAPVDNGNPYKYSVSGPALDFEGYTHAGTALKDAKGDGITQLGGQSVGLSAPASQTLVADPTNANNTVLKWDNSAQNAAADIYMNISTASTYAIKDRVNNAIVMSYDVYVEEASAFTSSMQPVWFTAYTPVRAHRQPSMGKKDADNINLSFGGKSVSFKEREWHNIKWVYEMGPNMATMYLDDVPFYNASLENGTDGATGFVRLDYIRTQMGKTAVGVLYIDNWHIYEGTKIPAALTATGYTAGESMVGDSVTLTGESYVAGATATIEKSTDGTTWTDIGTATTTVTLTEESVYYRTKAGNLYSDTVILYGVKGATGHPYKRIYMDGPKITFEDTTVETSSGGSNGLRRNGVEVKTMNNGSYTLGDANSEIAVVDAPNSTVAGDKALTFKQSTVSAQPFMHQGFPDMSATQHASVLEFDHYLNTDETISNLNLIWHTLYIDGTRTHKYVYMNRAANGTWSLNWSGATVLNTNAYKDKQWNKISFVIEHGTGTVYLYINDELAAYQDYGTTLKIDYLRTCGFKPNSKTAFYLDNWHSYIADMGDELVTTKKVWTNLDFEGLTITNNKVSTSAGTPIQNSVNGQFNATAEIELQTSSSDATPNGNTANLAVATVPADYNNGHGQALKYSQTGGGYSKTPSMINMYLGNAGNNFGSPDDKSNTPLEGDTYVTEFDFAFDSEDTGKALDLGQFRGSTINGRYVSLAKNANDFFTFHNLNYGFKLEANKWYHVKVVADPATDIVRGYLDGAFAGQVDHSSTHIGLWESFRLFGGSNINNSFEVEGVWFDNFNAYVEGVYVAPTTADIKLSKIAYDNGTGAVDTMADYAQLNATATVTNNGIAANAVVIFARYTNGGKKLAAISIKPITMATGQTAISVKGELGASSATDKVKVFIWDGLGTLVPGVTTAINAEL